jgi:hypothetical protein
MEKPEATKHSDSDDGHTRHSLEKDDISGAPVGIVNLRDPDEGASEEERKAIVCGQTFSWIAAIPNY